jgi:hypothetical protein
MLSWFPAAFRHAGIRFLSILFPPRTWAFVTSGLPATLPSVSGPDGFSAFHMRESRPGWAPPRPRGQRCSHGRRRISDRRLPFLHGQALDPGLASHLPRLWVTRHQRGFTRFTRPVFPSPAHPGWNKACFGFFPELRTPQLPATHVRAGTGLEH